MCYYETFLESLIGHSFVSTGTSPPPKWQWMLSWQHNGKQSHLLWGRNVDLHERAWVELGRRWGKHRPSYAQEERKLIQNWGACLLNFKFPPDAYGNLFITSQVTLFSYWHSLTIKKKMFLKQRTRVWESFWTKTWPQRWETPCCPGFSYSFVFPPSPPFLHTQEYNLQKVGEGNE